MSKQKGYNSIFFLTTLSIYLGLVLVGASPSVLAQQGVFSGKFEVEKEIESKDDLDKDPETDSDIIRDVEIIKNLKIASAINEFISDLRKLESIGKFNPKTDWNFSADYNYQDSPGDDVFNDIEICGVEANSNLWLETAIDQLVTNIDGLLLSKISDVFPNSKGVDKKSHSISVESSPNEFSIEFSFKKSNSDKARNTAEAFNRVFIAQKVALKDTRNLSIYENTKAKAENQFVTIVTRLPRGSLDALIKSESRAN